MWGGGGTCQSIHSMAATIKFGDYCHMGINQLAPFIGKYSIADGSTICHVKKCPTLCHPQTWYLCVAQCIPSDKLTCMVTKN